MIQGPFKHDLEMPRGEKGDPLLGHVIDGRFAVKKPLARGGMGRLYVAEQLPLGRVCALKVLDPWPVTQDDPTFARRFFLEASVASKLKHENTVTVFDYGRCERGVYYIAMELLEGRTLRQLLVAEGRLGELRAAHIARQIGRSLREAHALGVVHRDLKPANVMLLARDDEPDFVKVLDFGLAKPIAPGGEELTATGQFVGTPKYMAPEQIEGRRVGPHADVYALGILLYEMVAGRPPFEAEGSIHVMMAHLTQTPKPLEGVSDAYRALVERAMAKKPEARFASMNDMLDALAPFGTGPFAAMPSGRVPEIGPGRGSTASASGFTASTTAPPSTGPALRGADSTSGALPSLTTPSRLRPASSRWLGAFVAFGFAASIVSVAGLFALHLSRPPTVLPAPPAASLAFDAALHDAKGPPAEPAPPEAPPGTVRVETDPPGASVRVGGRGGTELCRATPCDLSPSAFGHLGPAGARLYVSHKGFAANVRKVHAGERHIFLRLRPSPAAAGASAEARGELDGYKPAPY